MFNSNEIHRITGALYLSTRNDNVQVVLGEKVLDEATGTKRDVDIVIAQSGSTAMLGIEVKAEARPLDTPLVEGLCLKLADMPSITTRQIVSTAGFTQPAIRKAEKHGVTCLRLVAGKVPPFDPIDMSEVNEVHYAEISWSNQEVRFNLSTGGEFPAADIGRAVVRVGDELIPALTFANRLLLQMGRSSGKHTVPGQHKIEGRIVLSDRPLVRLGNEEAHLDSAEIRGIMLVKDTTLPLDQSVYLEQPDGKPLAGAALVELPQGLFGVAVAEGGYGLTTFGIPKKIRDVRPIREVLTIPAPLSSNSSHGGAV